MIHYRVVLSPVAKADIRQAVEYYNNENRGLPMKKFPYMIIFKMDEPEQTVFMKAIFHTSQNPEKYPT